MFARSSEILGFNQFSDYFCTTAAHGDRDADNDAKTRASLREPLAGGCRHRAARKRILRHHHPDPARYNKLQACCGVVVCARRRCQADTRCRCHGAAAILGWMQPALRYLPVLGGRRQQPVSHQKLGLVCRLTPVCREQANHFFSQGCYYSMAFTRSAVYTTTGTTTA